MTRVIAIQDLSMPTRELLAGIRSGEEVIIEDAGHPVAKIVPIAAETSGSEKKQPRVLGAWKGKVWTSADFDDELPMEFWSPPGDPLAK